MSPSFGESYRCCGSYDMPCEHEAESMERRSVERRLADIAFESEPYGRSYRRPSAPMRRRMLPWSNPRTTPQEDFTPYEEDTDD